MNIRIANLISLFCILAGFSHGSTADDVVTFRELKLDLPATFRFEDVKSAGLYRKKLSSDFRIRGWEVTESLYLGQAKVGNKWGVGIVYEHGTTAYGINHRGVQMLKRF